MMELDTEVVAAYSALRGTTVVELAEGDVLYIEAGGKAVLKTAVPKGKRWAALLFVKATETDA
jgi:hypothetical protein